MRKALFGVVLLVVLAGCSGAIQPPGPSDDPAGPFADDRTITVANGTLPIDHQAVYDEVTRILAVDAEPPASIELEPGEEMGIQREPMPHFYRLVGIERPAGAEQTATALGYVRGPETVYVNEKLVEDETQLELTLTHEYVHVIQGRTDAFEAVREGVDAPNTTDGKIVRRSILEGAATSTETVYWERHVDEGTSPAAGMANSYRSTEGARQWVFAPYHFGYQYVQTRTSSPEEIDTIYADPPRTSEELLHGLPAGAEPLPPLAVDVQSTEWERNGTDRTGELFVRVALDTELDRERATTAAAGWGTDSRVALTDGEDRAYVWALRWDDPANATEFENAFVAYLDDRATREDGIWTDEGAAYDVTTVGDETVVIVLGDESFVRSASVDGTNGSVRVAA
ncbi:MAG: hypothetical protein ACOCSF_00130 [Halanaeroarchaeum sp.]